MAALDSDQRLPRCFKMKADRPRHSVRRASRGVSTGRRSPVNRRPAFLRSRCPEIQRACGALASAAARAPLAVSQTWPGIISPSPVSSRRGETSVSRISRQTRSPGIRAPRSIRIPGGKRGAQPTVEVIAREIHRPDASAQQLQPCGPFPRAISPARAISSHCSSLAPYSPDLLHPFAGLPCPVDSHRAETPRSRPGAAGPRLESPGRAYARARSGPALPGRDRPGGPWPRA